MYVIQEGVDVVEDKYVKPFHDIGPIAAIPAAGTYLSLAGWTGIAEEMPPCQKAGASNPRFPIYLDQYDPATMAKAYALFAQQAGPSSAFNNSIFMFEGYSTQGVKASKDDATAFAYRAKNLLTAPLISYIPADKKLDEKAAKLGNDLREVLRKGTGSKSYGSYVNYAFGNEGPESWYGSDKTRQDKLKGLKKKYDPSGKFSFFGPVA